MTGRGLFVLGSRGSDLALAQTAAAEAALRRAWPDLEVRVEVVKTAGDRGATPDQPAGAAGYKGLFTREIDRALLAGRIDAAVHSLKDVPGELLPDLRLAAVLPRAATGDLLVVKRRPVRRVGTGSVRRQRQLADLFPDMQIAPLRGNVPTRLDKLRDAPDLDAVVLAAAGLARLGIDLEARGFAAEPLPILPAIGQGAVVVATRAADARAQTVVAAINDPPTEICVRAERELLRLLAGDCNLPVGAASELVASTGRLRLAAVVYGEPGTAIRRAQAEGSAADPEAVAAAVFAALAADGAVATAVRRR